MLADQKNSHISLLQKKTYFGRDTVFKVKKILFEYTGYTSWALSAALVQCPRDASLRNNCGNFLPRLFNQS